MLQYPHLMICLQIIDSMDINLTNSRRQGRTGKPGVLQSMGSLRVMTERLNNNKKMGLHVYSIMISTPIPHIPLKKYLLNRIP